MTIGRQIQAGEVASTLRLGGHGGGGVVALRAALAFVGGEEERLIAAVVERAVRPVPETRAELIALETRQRRVVEVEKKLLASRSGYGGIRRGFRGSDLFRICKMN